MLRTTISKTYALGIAATISLAIFGLSLNYSYIFALISGLVFLSVFTIQTMLIKNAKQNALILSVGGLILLLIFYKSFSVALLAAVAAAILLLISGYHRGRLELNNNLEIRFWKTAKEILSYASSGLAIFVIVLYLSSFDVHDPIAAKKSLELIIRPIEPLVVRFIPGFSVKSSLTQIAASLLPAELKPAPEELKNKFIQESSMRLKDLFSNFFQTTVKTSDRVIDVFYKATIGKILNLSKLAQNLVLVIAGAVFFFLFRFILIFVNWAAMGLGWAIYQILWGAQFFKIELQSKSKKVIVL